LDLIDLSLLEIMQRFAVSVRCLGGNSNIFGDKENFFSVNDYCSDEN